MKVEWHQDSSNEPVTLYSEISNGEEVRKVEVYADGRVDYADSRTETGTTSLAQDLMPSVEELEVDPDFSAVHITPAEFQAVWERALLARG